MKALHFLKIMGLCLALLSLSTCKKYPEGGFVKQTCKHLFGSNKVGSSKTWKLKRYEVNGIDSTYLIQGANSIPDFYEKFVTFKLTKEDVTPKFAANTFLHNYAGTIGKAYKIMLFAYDWKTQEDSIQCKTINNIQYCQRNIFFPEFLTRNPEWNIKKLTSKELILSVTLKNTYKITLTC
jgi:hypothetical protein